MMNEISDEQLEKIVEALLFAWTYHVSKDEMRASENLKGGDTTIAPLTNLLHKAIVVVNEVNNG